MRVAIPYWENRISPVLDTAENFLFVDIQNGKRIKNTRINLSNKSPSEKVEYCRRHGVNWLLCGAVSDYYYNLISAKGIKIIPWLRGNIDHILEAFVCNSLYEPGFIMPGCKGWGHRKRYRKRGFKNSYD